MNYKKMVLSLILGIAAILLIYNFIVVPQLPQTVYMNGMGNGMHMGGMNQNTTVYNNSFSILNIAIIVLILTGFAAAAVYIFRSSDKRCAKCGYELKDPNWKICPVCGAKIQNNRR